MVIQKTSFSEQESACTDAGCQVCVLILLGNPIQQALIMPFATRSLSSWNNKYIQGWMIFYRRVWLHKQTTTAGDNPIFLGNCHNGEEVVFVAVFSNRASYRKDLERATKIKHLNIIEDEYANCR